MCSILNSPLVLLGDLRKSVSTLRTVSPFVLRTVSPFVLKVTVIAARPSHTLSKRNPCIPITGYSGGEFVRRNLTLPKEKKKKRVNYAILGLTSRGRPFSLSAVKAEKALSDLFSTQLPMGIFSTCT